jgi:hypothetical protein
MVHWSCYLWMATQGMNFKFILSRRRNTSSHGRNQEHCHGKIQKWIYLYTWHKNSAKCNSSHCNIQLWRNVATPHQYRSELKFLICERPTLMIQIVQLSANYNLMLKTNSIYFLPHGVYWKFYIPQCPKQLIFDAKMFVISCG